MSRLVDPTATALKFIRITHCSKATLRRDKLMGGAAESRLKVKCTKAASHLTQCVARGFTSGRMGDFTSETGKEAKRMAKESICGQMDRPTMANLKAMTATVSVSCITRMANVLKAFGKMAKSTAKAITFGRMVQSTLSSTLTV